MREGFVLAVVILGAAMAGCLENPKPTGKDESQSPLGTRMFQLDTLGRVLVSEARHRLSEFNAARDPNDADHVVVAAMDYDDPTGMPACVTYHSEDGGYSWRAGAPVPGLDRPHLRFDPWAAIDGKGTIHLVCIPERSQVGLPASNGVYYTQSTDRGRTWTPAVRVPTIDPAQRVDKVAMTTTANGTVMVCFGESGTGLVLARSFDGGTQWAPTVDTGASGLCGAILESADGRIHIGYQGAGRVRLITSLDGGTTWQRPVEVGPSRIYPYYNNAYRVVTPYPMSTMPSFALSPITGSIIAAAHDWDAAAERWRALLFASTDGGATFQSRDLPPFEPTTCGKCHAAHPLVAFDEYGHLGLQVAFVSDGGLEREILFSASPNEGKTWATPVIFARTGRDASWADARTWSPNFGGTANFVQYALQNPAEAPHVATWWAITASIVQPMQMRWGGEYWAMVGMSEGFLPLWLDPSENGVPQLWSDRVIVTQGRH